MGEVRATSRAVAARLVEIAKAIELRFVVDGAVLGEAGLRIDLAAARIHLDDLERRLLDTSSVNPSKG